MNVIVTSKNVELTDGLKEFLSTKLSKVLRLSSNSLQTLRIILDVDHKKRGVTQDAVIEIIGHVKGKPIAVKQSGPTFYAAFFGALSKLQGRLRRRKERMV